MNRPLILTVDLAGLALVPFLFRTLGPRRAVLIAIFGGLLVLPRGAQVLALGPATIELNKFLVSGLAVLLGVVLFDRRALLRARPDWLDLPMAACVASPLVSMAVNGFDRPREFLDGAWWKLAAWVVPYLLGRIYFGDAAGTSRVVVGVMAAGLLYIPVCLFETALGPRWYLLGVIYGIPPHKGVAHRLGGWRPEGMLNSGLELAAWMALASVVACWTWLSRSGVRLWRLPAWVPALALTSTSLACRGTYGYLLLGAGLLATALTQALRTRLVLVTLMLLPLVYIGLRVSGAWDGRQLEAISQQMGRTGTVDVRLEAESRLLDHVRGGMRTLAFGDGVYEWADAWWVTVLQQFGLAGLAAFLAAFFLVPAGLTIGRLPVRTCRGSPVSPAWGLALFVILHMIDSLHNTSLLSPTTLIGGALVGLTIDQRRRENADRPVIELVLVLVIWVLVEVIGHLPRTP